MAADASVSPSEGGVSMALRVRRRLPWLLAMALLLAILAALHEVSVLGALLALAAVAGALAILPDGATVRATLAPGVGAARPELLPGVRRVVESLRDPCFILGGDGTVRYANDLAIAAFAIRPGDRITFRLRYPELVAAFDRVARGDGPQEIEFVERVPTERWYSAWFAALDEEARPETILLVLDDLTTARAMERMRVDFVANASHELRTPLASLAGFVETLQGPAKDDANARDRFLKIMHDQARRMSRLIDDLLSLSRAEMKAHVRPRDPVDLMGVLRHVVETMAPLARELGVAIEPEIPPVHVIVPGDRDELVQVFDNLVENACKYGQSGGRVVVRMEPPEDKGPCRVSVIDFGPGIAAEHLPRLTERFYRIDADESRKHRGTGLGLAIVKHIATRHRARLTIDSEPGKGASFSLTFPEAETKKAAEKALVAAT